MSGADNAFRNEAKKFIISNAEGCERRVFEKSEIEEERIFSKEEILFLIARIAKEENIELDQLEVLEEICDKEGNLVNLSVVVRKEKAFVRGWKDIKYVYTIKGKGSFSDQKDYYLSPKCTLICRFYNSNDPTTAQGGVVAEYRDGQWQLNSGIICEKGEGEIE